MSHPAKQPAWGCPRSWAYGRAFTESDPWSVLIVRLTDSSCLCVSNKGLFQPFLEMPGIGPFACKSRTVPWSNGLTPIAKCPALLLAWDLKASTWQVTAHRLWAALSLVDHNCCRSAVLNEIREMTAKGELSPLPARMQLTCCVTQHILNAIECFRLNITVPSFTYPYTCNNGEETNLSAA